ncbi:hypothetical protein Bca4012_063391 [Brassica carinata]
MIISEKAKQEKMNFVGDQKQEEAAVINEVDRNAKNIGDELKYIHTKIDGHYNEFSNRIRALETQFVSMPSTSKSPMGSLPGKQEKNPAVELDQRIGSRPSRTDIFDSSYPSMDLLTEVESLRPAGLTEAEISRAVVGGEEFFKVGPISIIGVEEVDGWREKYRLSSDVIIRLPGHFYRVSDFGVDEVRFTRVSLNWSLEIGFLC